MRENQPRVFQGTTEPHEQRVAFSWPPVQEFQRMKREYVKQQFEDLKEILKSCGAQETEIPLLAELFAQALFVGNYVEDHLKPKHITDDVTIAFHREDDVDITAHASAEFLLDGKPLEEDDWASISEEQARDIQIENVQISFNLSSFEIMTETVNATIKKLRDAGRAEADIEKIKSRMLETYAAVIERIAIEETIHSIDIRRAASDVDVMKQIIRYHHPHPKDNFESYKNDPLEQTADRVVRSFLAAYYPDLKISEAEDATSQR